MNNKDEIVYILDYAIEWNLKFFFDEIIDSFAIDEDLCKEIERKFNELNGYSMKREHWGSFTLEKQGNEYTIKSEDNRFIINDFRIPISFDNVDRFSLIKAIFQRLIYISNIKGYADKGLTEREWRDNRNPFLRKTIASIGKDYIFPERHSAWEKFVNEDGDHVYNLMYTLLDLKKISEGIQIEEKMMRYLWMIQLGHFMFFHVKMDWRFLNN